jgi:hypothetical protein
MFISVVCKLHVPISGASAAAAAAAADEKKCW